MITEKTVFAGMALLFVVWFLTGCAGGGYYAPSGSHYQYQQQIRNQHRARGMSAGRRHMVPNATLPHFGGQQMQHGMSAGR